MLRGKSVACLFATVVVGLCWLRPAWAESAGPIADDPRVADAVRAWMEWVEYQAAVSRVPGMSVGIVHDQELIATNAFGMADPEAGKPAEPDTLYSICSISKLFTSIAVMQQRDAGKLRLDDPVATHLPWFNIQDVHPQDEPITIKIQRPSPAVSCRKPAAVRSCCRDGTMLSAAACARYAGVIRAVLSK